MELRGTRAVRGLAWAASILCATWVAWAAARSISWPILNDASLFHYVGWCIADGAVPYAGVFDFQMPGTLLLHLGFVSAFGADDLAWRLLDLGALAVAAWLLVRILRPFGALSGVVAASIYAGWHLALGAWNTGQRDFLLGVLLLGAVDRLLALRGGARDVRAGAVAGALAGAAVTIKPTAAVFVLLVVVLCARWSGRRAALASLSASVVAPLVCVAWLVASGAWPAFVEIVREYLIGLHPYMERMPPLEVARRWATNAFVVPLGIAACIALARGPRSRERLLLAAGVLFGFAHLALQAKGWEYHFEPAASCLVALAASALAPPERSDSPAVLRDRGLAAVLASALLVRAFVVIAPRVERNIVAPRRVEHVRSVVDAVCADLRALVPPGARAQVFDSASYGVEALLRLGLRQPTRFTYNHPLLFGEDQPYAVRLREEFLSALERDPPAAMVVFGFDTTTGRNAELAQFPAFARLLDDRYSLVHDRGAWRVYVPGSKLARDPRLEGDR